MNLGFGDFEELKPWDWGLVFLVRPDGWYAESYSGSRVGTKAFNIGRDARGNNLMTGQRDGYL